MVSLTLLQDCMRQYANRRAMPKIEEDRRGDGALILDEDTPRLKRKGGFKLSPTSTRRKSWRRRRDS